MCRQALTQAYIICNEVGSRHIIESIFSAKYKDYIIMVTYFAERKCKHDHFKKEKKKIDI